MFLKQLNLKEKKAFLQLAYVVANVDGIGDKEKEMIRLYCQEMEIEDIGYKDKKIGKILKNFKDKKSQKIVLMEIFGLIYSDEIYTQKEKKLIKQINKVFNFSQVEMDLCKEWAKSMLTLANQGELIIQL